MSHDPSFEALAALPGHISSFVADANDGRILDTTSDPKEAQAQALTAYQILQDVTHLLAKQHEDVQAKEQPGALRRVMVNFTDYSIGVTVKADKIYGVQRNVPK